MTNIQLSFTTWLNNTTFHNGGMHDVQNSQAMLEYGVYELAHFSFISFYFYLYFMVPTVFLKLYKFLDCFSLMSLTVVFQSL